MAKDHSWKCTIHKDITRLRRSQMTYAWQLKWTYSRWSSCTHYTFPSHTFCFFIHHKKCYRSFPSVSWPEAPCKGNHWEEYTDPPWRKTPCFFLWKNVSTSKNPACEPFLKKKMFLFFLFYLFIVLFCSLFATIERYHFSQNSSCSRCRTVSSIFHILLGRRSTETRKLSAIILLWK